MLKSINLKVNHHTKVLLAFFCFTILARFPAQDGEDIVNARLNLHSANPVDFWGGMSSLVYGNAPSFPFNWQSQLVFIQICLVFFGLKCLDPFTQGRARKLLILTVYYFAFLFGSQTTRDGLLFSLSVASFGLLAVGIRKSKLFGVFLGTSCLIIAISFRPWLALAVAPFLMYFLSKKYSNKVKIAIIGLVLIVSPVLLDQAAAKTLNLRESYPQQQVMIMDFAASYCWGNNIETGEAAISALQEFTLDEKFSDKACNLFRADTWLSLTNSHNLSAMKGVDSDFWLVAPGNDAKFNDIQDTWIKMILGDPVTYFQNKLMFGSKLVIGSDTRGLRFLNEPETLKKIQGLLFIPYDIAITGHLWSIGIFVFFTIVYLVRRKFKDGVSNFEVTPPLAVCFFSSTLWLGLSSIAYIGSNGRYTYTVTLLSAIFLLKEHE
jgi:hypothetical protein